MPLGVRPTASFMDIEKWPPNPCVLRQQVETMYSDSTTAFGSENPFCQWLPGGLKCVQSSSPSSSKLIRPKPSSWASAGIPLSSMTFFVCGGPLLSPREIWAAPRDFSSRMIWRSVSLWVEPGAASAVLKFGLMRTDLPLGDAAPRSRKTSLTPWTRSVVLIRTTVVVAP
jgi:hypothetical protein